MFTGAPHPGSLPHRDDVRASEARRLSKDGFQPLKKSRWCLLKRKENLTSQQKIRLRDLLRYNLQTVPACLICVSTSRSRGGGGGSTITSDAVSGVLATNAAA